MGQKIEMIHKKRNADGPKTYKKMLNPTHNKINAI